MNFFKFLPAWINQAAARACKPVAPVCLDVSSSNLGLNLAHQAVLRLPDAWAATVVCVEGLMWITEANDPRDRLLAVGESFDVATGRGVVLYALTASRVNLVAQRAEPRVTVKAPVGTSSPRWFGLTPRLHFAGVTEWA